MRNRPCAWHFLQVFVAVLYLAIDVSLVQSEPHKPMTDEDLTALTKEYSALHTQTGKDRERQEIFKKISKEIEYRPARKVKVFAAPWVATQGSAENVGIDQSKLTEYLKLRFLNTFGFMQKDFSTDGYDLKDGELGAFQCTVWTVGASYPIAFHVECIGGPVLNMRHWHDAVLGFGNQVRAQDEVKKAVSDMLDDYAVYVLKAHGKL